MENSNKKIINAGLFVVAGLYIIFLIRIILFKNDGLYPDMRYNFLPVSFALDIYMENASLITILKNVIGNVILFMPLGMLLPLTFRGVTLKKAVITGFLLSLTFETIQLFTRLGIGDVDDVILNTLGCTIGYGLGISVLAKNKLKSKSVILTGITVLGLACGIVHYQLKAESYQKSMAVNDYTQITGSATASIKVKSN